MLVWVPVGWPGTRISTVRGRSSFAIGAPAGRRAPASSPASASADGSQRNSSEFTVFRPSIRCARVPAMTMFGGGRPALWDQSPTAEAIATVAQTVRDFPLITGDLRSRGGTRQLSEVTARSRSDRALSLLTVDA